MIAEVIVNSTANELDKTFDYNIPEGLNVELGMRVLVPFANRKVFEVGYVVGLKETSEFRCKSIVKIVDQIFDDERLNLAQWISKKYFCNLAESIRLLVPPGTSTNLNRVKEKTEKVVHLNLDADFSKIKSEKQKKVIDFLIDNISAPKVVLKELTDASDAIIKTLEKNGYIRLTDEIVFRNPFACKDISCSSKLKLTEEQEKVIKNIALNKFEKYLIHGVTGSGKTEIYLQLIEDVLKSGKSAVVLVPEISLTPQITDRFLARFGKIVAILHSGLSVGERYDEWHKINSGEAKIVIGARSAIFAPIKNVGIIIIDEEHDSSYKSDNLVKYDAKEVAERIAYVNNVPIIFGSATPSINTYYNALNGNTKLLTLEKRISKSGLPNIEIIDMRDELATGNKTVFSRKLYRAMKDAISKKEQIMLFLNRRGYSTFIMCRDCGHVVKCEECDVSMTYHSEENKLICHYCGKTKEVMNVCPMCTSKNIRYFGTGTQKIEAEIKKYFPEASVIRMDVDTTRVKNGHEKIINKFRDEKIDILLGTQMIAKGHDFSNVTLVGILAADSSMNIGDYRANEKTYQLLTQMAGRAGRGEKKGTAIVQTYMPDEFCIQCVKKQDFTEFYKNEINVREKLNYPPFYDIIVSVISGSDEEKVKNEAMALYQLFAENFTPYSPVPAPISKISNEYRWRILIKDNLGDEKIELLRETIKKYRKIQNAELKVTIDVNPNNML
ncbi:MAG: primosomal protein N' [Clostridia bacterium]|nr:primosomal protein N' [Clostridia bacterium]